MEGTPVGLWVGIKTFRAQLRDLDGGVSLGEVGLEEDFEAMIQVLKRILSNATRKSPIVIYIVGEDRRILTSFFQAWLSP